MLSIEEIVAENELCVINPIGNCGRGWCDWPNGIVGTLMDNNNNNNNNNNNIKVKRRSGRKLGYVSLTVLQKDKTY